MPANVSTPLPQLDLPAFATATVTLDDPAAVITVLRVHGWQSLPPADQPAGPEPLWIPTEGGGWT